MLRGLSYFVIERTSRLAEKIFNMHVKLCKKRKIEDSFIDFKWKVLKKN